MSILRPVIHLPHLEFRCYKSKRVCGCSFAVSWCSGGLGHSMKLPFAVYTAREGYAWQSGTEAGLAKLERFRKAIGKMPEFDFGDSASSGLLNVGDDVVLYRFMRQKNADFKGRDAVYLAMTYFTRPEARFVDADAVLKVFPFVEPLPDPPSDFDYCGSAALPTDFAVPAESATGCFHPEGHMASAGFVVAQPFPGILHVSRAEPANGKGAAYRYQLARPASPAKPAKTAVLTPLPAPPPEKRAAHAAAWRRTAIAAILVAIAEAVALIWLWLPQDAASRWHQIKKTMTIFAADEPARPSQEQGRVPSADLPEIAPINRPDVRDSTGAGRTEMPTAPENELRHE